VAETTWDEPGVEQVLEGVFRIPLPLPNDGLRAVNVYAIVDGDGLVLIDGGWALAETQQRLERGLAEIEFKLSDIREFLVTHVHRDHYTGAIMVRRLLGTPVRIGAGERESLEQSVGVERGSWGKGFNEQLASAGATELLARVRANWSAPEGDNGYEMPDGWIYPGEISLESRRFEVVETPGHTRGHVVFHDLAAAALFAGDHVLPRITPSIGLEPKGASLPLQNYLDSLALVRGRPDAKLLPAHGPVTDSVHERVDQLLAFHEERLAACVEAIDEGATSSFEVASILRWTRHQRHLDDMEEFNQVLAIGETRVHLDVCVVRGWLRSSTDADGIVRFERA
jgi:glyoxylase-like metal-dependent hydrolase (beta-lactamase superfamily II)